MSDQFLKALIVIPSLEPDNRLLLLLENLQDGLRKPENSSIQADILLVDDGSGADYFHIFEQAEQQYNCTILRHAVNLGKGRALKTAFNYYLNEYPDYCGVVMADADGQHAADDIIKCIKGLSDNDALILGCRDFSSKNVPLKSLIGNKLTRNIFAYLCGVRITDTQTGLRAIPTQLVKTMIMVPGERYEYEMNMLVECGNKKIKIKELPIETIYLDNNKGSHFNPLLDSIRVYKTLIKYILSALSSFLLDISLFAIIVYFSREYLVAHIIFSTIIARVVSSLYNYLVNRNVVFAGSQRKNTFIKYYALAAFIMLASGILTTLLFNVSFLGEVSSKVVVDLVLFLLGYFVQRKWIF